MSEQSWRVIVAVHVFLIIVQQILPSFVETTWSPGIRGKGCPQQKQFFSEKIINGNRHGGLQGIFLNCTATTVYKAFKIKNSKRMLCDCGKAQEQTINCKKKSYFLVNISVESLSNQWGDNCSFTLMFKNKRRTFSRHIITIKKIPKRNLVSSYDVTRLLISPFLTPYITSVYTNPASGIGLRPTTATSYIFGQTELVHLTTLVTRQISTTMIKPLPSQSFIPVYTGIIIRPSIYKSNVFQRSVPATPGLSTKPVLMTSSPKETIALNNWTFIQASMTTFEAFSRSTLSPDEEKMKKLKQDVEFISNVNISTVKIGDKNTINHILDAAANLIKTNLTADNQAEDPGMKAVEVLEDLGNSISQQLHLGNNESVTFEKLTEDLVFGAAVINTTTSPGYTFPSNDIKMTGGERVNIPNSVFVSDKSYFVGIIFKAYREMRNNTGGLSLGTKVINAVVSPRPGDELEDPVEMTFGKNIVGPTLTQQCSFWIENNTLSGEHGRWSTRQCFKTFENETIIKCACRHFTNFAVLFKVSDEEKPLEKEHSFRLVIITYVGLSLSILGCLLTFLIYAALPNIKSDRATIHKNLVCALGIADVIFLVTVAVKPDEDLCTTMALLAFFFYLAVFFWMLVEGVYIYLMVIKVFRGNVARRRRVSYIVGWGCPVIIALVTWAILKDDVVSKYHCWLSIETGAIWAFVGPGLAIILTNCIILIAVMRTTWATFVGDKEYGGVKSAAKTFGALIPILGITWIFGVMAFNDSSIVFQYIFAIVNSIQGALIFILYCIVNNEVRNEITRRITVWQTRREMSSSSRGKRATHQYNISSEKNTTFNRTTASAQGTPDLYRYPLSEIKEVPPSEKVEKRYSFETPGKTFKNDLNLEAMQADKDCRQKAGDDKESGQESPVEVELDKNLEHV